MRVKNVSDGEGYRQLMLGMVTSTGQAILQLRESNDGVGHNYRPTNTSDSGIYGKAMLGMVVCHCRRRVLIVQNFFLEKVCSNNCR